MTDPPPLDYGGTVIGGARRAGMALTLALAALGTVLGLALTAGCGSDAVANQGPELTRNWPAAVAGGACQLLDYDTIEATLGTRFDTAGAGQRGETYTCAVTAAGVEYPDLTLAVTATKADKLIFTSTVVPSGSVAVTGLGRAAYRTRLAPAGKSGPRLEVGWLSGNQRLMVLRYSLPAKTATAAADALAPKLVELAKRIDQTNI